MPVQSENTDGRESAGEQAKLTPRRGGVRGAALRRRRGRLEPEALPAAAEVLEQLLGEVGAEIRHLGHLPAAEEESRPCSSSSPSLTGHCTMNLSLVSWSAS